MDIDKFRKKYTNKKKSDRPSQEPTKLRKLLNELYDDEEISGDRAKRAEDILQLIRNRKNDNTDFEGDNHYNIRVKKVCERATGWSVIDIVREAALIGAKYGDEWSNHTEVNVAEGIIESNPLTLTEKVLEELEDSIPPPKGDTAERAAAILAFIKKREADPSYKPTEEEKKLIRPLEPGEE
jgi:hypothetical protein